MKLTQDEPGRLLLLESEPPQVPKVVIGCAAVLFAPLMMGPAHLLSELRAGSELDGFDLLFGFFFLPAMLAVTVVAHRASWIPARLRADRYAGELEIRERNLLTRGERGETIALDHLARLSVARVAPSAASAATYGVRPPNVRLRLWTSAPSGRRRERELLLGVEGIDKREEIADLAYRLGAAAGLPYQRVVRSDPRDVEIDLTCTREIGYEVLPPLEKRADYALDRVADAARTAAARELVPPFDPAGFRSTHKARVWEPGREVRFEKPFGWYSLAFLPVVPAGVLAGPALFFLMARDAEHDLMGRALAAAFVSIFGLPFAAVGVAVVYFALPRRVRLDWGTGRLTIDGLVRKREFRLDEITAVELRSVRTYHSGGKNRSSYHSYRGEVHAHLRAAVTSQPQPVELLHTSEFREDPDTPYRQALPLVTELAEALQVERRLAESSS